MKPLFGAKRSAVWSPCKSYRYQLLIEWGEGPRVNWLMLNPSTADEFANDPTVERCERRSRVWGFGSLIVTNLFAFRATDPKMMKGAADPVGPWNDDAITGAANDSAVTICGWGEHGKHRGQGERIHAMLLHGLRRTYALAVNASGEPKHPLYVRYDVQPVAYGAMVPSFVPPNHGGEFDASSCG